MSELLTTNQKNNPYFSPFYLFFKKIFKSKRNEVDPLSVLEEKMTNSLSIMQNKLNELKNSQEKNEHIISTHNDNCNSILRSLRKTNITLEESSANILKANVLLEESQNQSLISASVLEMAEYMHTSLLEELVSKRIKKLLQCDEENDNEIENNVKILSIMLKKYENYLQHINLKLEKHNLKIQKSIWSSFLPEVHNCEVIESCSQELFNKIMHYSFQYNILTELNETGIVLSEIQPAVLIFNSQKESWVVKRFSKVTLLTPASQT